MSRRIMSAKARQVSSWLDDAPMPPPLPAYADPYSQFPSTSYADRETFSPHYPRQIKAEPGAQMMSPRSIMSPFSSTGSLTPRPGLYSGNFCIKREVDTPFSTSTTQDIRENYGAMKLEESFEPQIEVQRVRQRDLQHVIAEGTIASEKNIKTEIGWIECLFHDEYEKDQEPRATFTTMNNHFIIDGLLTPENFTDTSDRFCLGKSVIQTNLTKLVRMIGKGVEITRDETGNVTLTNIGRSAVFVLCPDYAVRNGDPFDSVYKLQSARDRRDVVAGAGSRRHKIQAISGRQMLIFDATRFVNGLQSSTSALDLDKINMSCFTRLSFLKGFGRNYPARPDITNCPLWVELKICEPLNDIDRKFHQIYPSEAM